MQAASCREVEFGVDVLGARQTIRGTECRPSGDRRPQAAIVLLHGAGYSRDYWDFPVRPERHSALRRLATAGHLTLAVDRLGAGESSRPPAAEVTVEAKLSALHQVVAAFRGDPARRTRSGKVFLVGHSAGSVLAIRQAVEADGRIDGVVVTGFQHSAGPGSALFAAITGPADEDPRFTDLPGTAGYGTTRPGLRGIFYFQFNAEESVVEADERTKSLWPQLEPNYFVDELLSGGWARRLEAPVLVLNGARDPTFCAPPDCPEAAREGGFYPASSDVTVLVRERAGHSLNLHRDAAETTDLIGRWIGERSR